jgi:LDH2 family malate/lactate/ureidoglycolate dehydrogenase
MELSIKKVRRFVVGKFKSLGVPKKDAKICADVLLAADKMGIATHGLSRLGYYLKRLEDGIQFPVTNCVVAKNAAVAVLDANHGMGQVAAYRATKVAIKAAKKYGVGCVAVKNSSHFGIAGYYTLMCAKKGCIGISMTNSRPCVAPFGSRDTVLGTNPISVAAPSTNHPFMLDCATSIIQRGNLEVATDVNELLPYMVYDHPPQTVKESIDMLEAGTAALLPIGEHKGYGISTAIEILSTCLTTSPFLKGLLGFYEGLEKKPYSVGHFIAAINIPHFVDEDDFRSQLHKLSEQLRSSGTNVLVAGDVEQKALEANKETIPVTDVIYSELQKMGYDG